jgi:hypothetical protein
MSDEPMTLEERFTRLEARFDALERRFAALENVTSRVLSLLVRIAERQGIEIPVHC